MLPLHFRKTKIFCLGRKEFTLSRYYFAASTNSWRKISYSFCFSKIFIRKVWIKIIREEQIFILILIYFTSRIASHNKFHIKWLDQPRISKTILLKIRIRVLKPLTTWFKNGKNISLSNPLQCRNVRVSQLQHVFHETALFNRAMLAQRDCCTYLPEIRYTSVLKIQENSSKKYDV